MTDAERSGDSARPEGDREHGFGRHETTEERADRQWTEILQEVRVAQTGAQILFGFLLSVVFTPRFEQLSPFDTNLYVVTVVLGALATGALVAPVSFHRTLAGHRRKPELIQVTERLIATGLALLAAAIVCAVLLLLRVALETGFAWAIAGLVLIWFACCWLALPLMLKRHLTRAQ